MRLRLFIVSLTAICFAPLVSFSQTISDYLILQDISSYKLDRPEKMLPGRPPTGGPETYNNPGVVGAADHFSLDHADVTYEIGYFNLQTKVGPEIQITQHSGSESDKWLLHEVELSYQKSDTLGAGYAAPNPLRDIAGNKILFMWGYYAWVSNNVVVSIQFTDLTGTKPEPLEVVQAYLQKFPSTISTTVVLDTAHKKQWIKDEMDRRLWLCDRWFYQLQLGKVDQNKVLQEAVDNMNEFLDYREKYYGISAKNEKNLLVGYQNTSNGTGIKAKLKEYKDWWNLNKYKAITLP